MSIGKLIDDNLELIERNTQLCREQDQLNSRIKRMRKLIKIKLSDKEKR